MKGYNALGFGVIPNLLAASGKRNTACARIFDADNGSCQGCLYFTPLKAEVGIQHFAIDEFESLAIAKRLCANDGAVDKGYIFTIPPKVFPFDCAVGENHVFGVPKGILGIKIAIFKIGIFDVLEGIFARELDILKVKLPRAKHKVFANHGAVLHFDFVNHPTELSGNDIAIANDNVRALAQSLGSVELAIGDFDIFTIPQSRSAKGRELAFFDYGPHVMPKRIAQIEVAVAHLNVAALLEGTLAIGGTIKGAVFHARVLATVKRALGIKILILDQFHHGFPFLRFKGRSLFRLWFIIAYFGEQIKMLQTF